MQNKDKLPVILDEKVPWNKLCVYIVTPYKIGRKRKPSLFLKDVTMIDSIT